MITCSPPPPADDSSPESFRRFRSHTFEHPRFRDAKERILALITPPQTQNMALLLGPTGTGKTRVIGEAMRELEKRGRPAIGFECFPALQSTSPFRGFFSDYLQATGDPFVGKPRTTEGLPSLDCDFISSRGTLDAMSRALCQRVTSLRPSAVFIDEASVFADLPHAQTEHSLKLFKALANKTGIPHVLVGTQALLNFLALDSQLQRRGRIVHFDSYSVANDTEKKHFVKSLEGVLRVSPLPASGEILRQPQNVYELCFGAIGILVDLVLDGCKIAYAASRDSLTMLDLEAAAVRDYSGVILEEQENLRARLGGGRKHWLRSKGDGNKKRGRRSPSGRVGRKNPKQYPTP